VSVFLFVFVFFPQRFQPASFLVFIFLFSFRGKILHVSIFATPRPGSWFSFLRLSSSLSIFLHDRTSPAD
jgi:hypothetical protein